MGGFLLFLAGTSVGMFLGLCLSALFATSKKEDKRISKPRS